MKKDSVLVVFGDEVPIIDLSNYDVVLKSEELNEFIESGSIYEASAFTEKLAHVECSDGRKVSKVLAYEGYDMWWINYNALFTYFGLPYAKYRRLLEHLKSFKKVSFQNAPFKSLFLYYLSAYGCQVEFLDNPRFRLGIPLGILLQIILTFIALPVLILKRAPIMIFIGDKFEPGKDYDFRMKYIYQELRSRGSYYVEFVRSLESWKTVLKHFFIRRRPVIYSEAVGWIGKLLGSETLSFQPKDLSPEEFFKFLVATHYLKNASQDILATKLTKLILRTIGVRSVYITATNERNFHAFLGAKLNNLPTVGILHGLPSRFYNAYDFLPGFGGRKSLGVDKYGLWSRWWKDYYARYSNAYKPEQMYVSGLMRPLERKITNNNSQTTSNIGKTKVLFVSEQLAAPEEVMPYLERLIKEKNIELYIKFRPYRDGFEQWLEKNRPEVLKDSNIRILKGDIKDAIKVCDVAVGSHSTAVFEALLQFKMPIFFSTHKWGDCFELKDYKEGMFFAENPGKLVEKIKNTALVSEQALQELSKRYFGDPYKNGGKWVVDQLEAAVLKGRTTR